MNATRLHDEYQWDELKEEDLEGNATALFHQSQVDRELASTERSQAQQDYMKEVDLRKIARHSKRRARWCAFVAFLSTLTMLYVFIDYLLILLKRREHLTSNKMDLSGIECDASTVASSVMSEESPLMIVDSATDDSYTTIELTSQTTTASSSSYMSLSQVCQRIMRQMAPLIHHWAPTMEFAVVALVVLCSTVLLLREIACTF
jgi:hypothetical protein